MVELDVPQDRPHAGVDYFELLYERTLKKGGRVNTKA